MAFASQLSDYLKKEEQGVLDIMTGSLRSGIELLDMANAHLLSHQGKRLRSKLMLLIGKALEGAASDKVSRLSAASELLHNATLLHDDVADDSSFRRGVPTAHSLLGARAAVLLGDYWLVKAMDLVISCDCGGGEFTRIYSKTLGDLAEGELLELQKAENADTSREDYLRIIYLKTASLFEVCCVAAAMACGASTDVIEDMREYGVSVGMAFQIKDDIMDYGSLSIGKPVGLDLSEKKITLPLLCTLEDCSKEEEESLRAMIRQIEAPGNEEAVCQAIRLKDGVKKAEAVLEEYISKAKSALGCIPEGEARDYLDGVASYVSSREV